MLKILFPALRMLLVLTIITGVAYPLVITAAAQVLFPTQANGSLILNGETVIGSSLIGQNMNGDVRYFWSRPSAINYAPMPSGGSNLAPTSATLQTAVAERADVFITSNSLTTASGLVPAEMVFASGSGLDPHISPAAARLQAGRVAAARGLDAAQVLALIDGLVEAPQWGFLGQERVNVLLLNLALDGLQ
jgi:K+-transporting ATPase ATPase C chain